MILLIDNYDSFTFNLYQYFRRLDEDVEVIKNDLLDLENLEKKYKAIVISPGPGTPQSSGQCLDAIHQFHQKLPFLGICLGHQSIGEYFGCQLTPSTKIIHGKVDQIFHSNHPLFDGLSNPFQATRYHSLQLDLKKQSDLEVISYTEKKDVMGIAHRNYPLFGLQFHPESYETVGGIKILENFLNYYVRKTNEIS